jgi:hypothetical protein
VTWERLNIKCFLWCVCVCLVCFFFFLKELFSSLSLFFSLFFSLYFFSIWDWEREGVRGDEGIFFSSFSLSLSFLSWLVAIFFYIFSAWNTTIWEAVWLSLLLLETWCEKICVDLYLLNVFFGFIILLYYSLLLLLLCVVIIICFLNLVREIERTDLGDSVSWEECCNHWSVCCSFFSSLFFLLCCLKKLSFFFFSIESLCRAFSIYIILWKRGELSEERGYLLLWCFLSCVNSGLFYLSISTNIYYYIIC